MWSLSTFLNTTLINKDIIFIDSTLKFKKINIPTQVTLKHSTLLQHTQLDRQNLKVTQT